MDADGYYSFNQDDLHASVDAVFDSDNQLAFGFTDTENQHFDLNNLENSQVDMSGAALSADTSLNDQEDTWLSNISIFNNHDQNPTGFDTTTFNTTDRNILTGSINYSSCDWSNIQQPGVNFDLPAFGIASTSFESPTNFSSGFDQGTIYPTTSPGFSLGEDFTWCTGQPSVGFHEQVGFDHTGSNTYNFKAIVPPTTNAGGIGHWGPLELTANVTGSDINAPFALNQPGQLRYRPTEVCAMGANQIQNILSAWPGRCTWPGCDSEAFLKTRKLLETHVYNLHLNPLVCNEPGCNRSKPFAKQGDLERHKASIHGNRTGHRCPQTTCPRHSRGFPRKDKLLSHMKSHVPRVLYCQFAHCIYHVNNPRRKRFRSNNEDTIHQATHGPYECGLGECYGSKSSFSLQTLTNHLISQHKKYGCSPRDAGYPTLNRSISNGIQELFPTGGTLTYWIYQDGNNRCTFCDSKQGTPSE